MIDKLFGALEDIYFTVLSEPTSDDGSKNSIIVFSSVTLEPLIEEFKEYAQTTTYRGKSGDQFRLLKLGTYFLNYMMYEDDGKFTDDEKELLENYLHHKLSRLISTEKDEIKEVFNIQVSLPLISEYILEHDLPIRSIDMILDRIIDHIDNQPRYFGPLEDIYKMLLEQKK